MEESVISHREERNARISFNVSGEIFETHENTLQRYPETLLGNVSKRRIFFCSKTNQYFFNRHKLSFEAILFFYQSTGKLYRPPDVCWRLFEAECEFFELPEVSITAMKERDGIYCIKTPKKLFQSTDISPIRINLWNFLENPETSIFARNFAFLSSLICVNFCRV